MPKTVTEAVEILLSELGSVYCHNCCNRDNDDACDECNRRAMNWGLAPDVAHKLVDDILSD